MVKQQQEGFVPVEWQKSQWQQQFHRPQDVQTWRLRKQQEKTINRQFTKTEQKIGPYLMPVYKDKTTKQICLFHGTTTDSFQIFESQGTIMPNFFLTFDLEEALFYANDRNKRKLQRHPDRLPGLLVFRIKKGREKVLKELPFSDTHIVLRSQQDIDKLLKNSLVEMISIKPPSVQQKPKSVLSRMLSAWR